MKLDGKKKGETSQAHKLGLLYAKHIMELDPEVKKLSVRGGGFWDKFTSGMKSVAKAIPATIATAGVITGQPEIVAPMVALHGLVNGKGEKSDALSEFISTHKGSGKKEKKQRKPRKASDKMKRRSALIRKLMKEKGMKMTDASKHIKANNLTY